MQDDNFISVSGNVGQDPKVGVSTYGPWAFLSICNNKTQFAKDKKDQKPPRPRWFKLKATKGCAEFIAKHIKQGTRVAVIGELDTKVDGETTETFIVVKQISKLPPLVKNDQQAAPVQNPPTQQQQAPVQAAPSDTYKDDDFRGSADDDDMPF